MPESTYLVRPGFGMPHSAARYAAGCRCLLCAAAYQGRAEADEWRRQRAKRTAAHGTLERASGGCRCVPCRHVRHTAVAS